MYKSQEKPEVEPRLLARQWLLDLLDTQKQAGTPAEFLEHLKIDLFPDEVYVFTPKGEIKKFPSGSTALDFAYAVHSDVGNRCIGARINQQPVALHHELRNGDHVEVLTSKGAQPTPSWLNYVVTSKARAEIRGHLKKQQHHDSVRLGKVLLDRALKTLGDKRRRLSSRQKVALLQALDLDDWNDLLADIGLGRRPALIVARQLAPGTEPKPQPDGPQQPLAIQGAEGMAISYAKCCRPVPGDPIVGIFSQGRGIVIHTNDCPNLPKRRDSHDNWIDVQWATAVEGQFPVSLRLETRHEPGVLASLTTIIAGADSNINHVSVTERDDNYATISFIIEVRDRRHLEDIMARLDEEKSVIRINRIKG